MRKVLKTIKTSDLYQALKYLLAGFATTALNFIIYFLLCETSNVSPVAANAAAWVVSVFFAYAVNSKLVFKYKKTRFLYEIKSFFGFFAARLFSAIAETSGIWFFVEKRNLDDYAVKLALTIFVILFNYVWSKFIIFKNEQEV